MIAHGTLISARYEVIRLIGEGGMGEVYEAKHVHIGKRVALKCLNKAFTKDAEAVERFQQEARIAGTLGHANICEVMDFGVTGDGQPYLVMEYMEGESLADLIKREKKLPVERALEVTASVLSALEEAHGQGIVHRDLKPENIFMANIKGHGEVVKLLDFGISKIMKPGESAMRLTKTGMMVGTPFYMSPEQVRGRTDVDHRSDLYACAVMLYEMLTGKVPFEGSTFNEIIIKIIEDPFPTVGKADGVPRKVANLIRKTADKRPEKRIQTAREFRENVEKIQAGKSSVGSSTAMAVEAYSPEGSSERSHGGLIALLVVSAIVLIAGIGVLVTWGILSKNRKPPPAETAPAAAPEVPAKPEPPPEPQMVKIELEGLPEHAVVELNGREVDGNVLETAKSTEPVIIDVTAPGYLPRKVEIVPGGDMSFEVALEKKQQDEKPRPKKTKPKKKPADKTKKKKPSLEWGYPG